MSGFDFAPTLTGETLTLRPLAADDFEALHAVAADPAIWALHPAHDRWQRPVFRRFVDDALAAGGGLVAIDRASGEVIGSSRFSTARAGPGEVEIGWSFLARSHWGGGPNGEMKRLMLAHVFRFVPRAIFLIGRDNLRSRRAIEKIGGVLTERCEPFEMGGRTVEHVTYAIEGPL